jgi:hypothetical protein
MGHQEHQSYETEIFALQIFTHAVLMVKIYIKLFRKKNKMGLIIKDFFVHRPVWLLFGFKCFMNLCHFKYSLGKVFEILAYLNIFNFLIDVAFVRK